MLEEVPPNATAVGVPARIVRVNGRKVDSDMDQVHIPDPISQELCRMRGMIERLELELKEMKKTKGDGQHEDL